MGNVFARWFVSLSVLLNLSCSLKAHQDEDPFRDWLEDLEDKSLVLPEGEPEFLVSITGQLQRNVLNIDPEDNTKSTFDCWVLKLTPESFELACSTPVRAIFHTPESIRSLPRCHEIELTGGYDEEWFKEHIGQTVTVQGYLWHAHTAHHHTPMMLDKEPWLK